MLSRVALIAALLATPAIAQDGAAPSATTSSAAIVPPVAVAPRLLPTLTDPQAALLRRMLAGARDHGVTMGAQAETASSAELAEAALAYARLVHSGSLSEADYLRDWGMRAQPYDPLPGFVAAAASDDLKTWVASLPPPYAGYENLRRGLSRYRALAAAGGWKPIAAGPDLGMGSAGERVAALRARLAVEDKAVAATGLKFDAGLADAVRRAQRRFGLAPTGVVASATLAALNTSPQARIDQIIANMERWRWLPAALPADRIQVNIAAAVLTFYKDDAPALSMRAATGRPGDPTPILTSEIHSIVLNPPWNVPSGIAKKELWPKGAGWLKRNGYRVISTPDGGQRLQQASGPQSALGRYKFDFPNDYAVYLHDSPARAAFGRYNRSVSHGCVRLERPADLAKRLLEPNPDWQPETVDAAVEVGKTIRAPLAQPIAVYLLYWTAFADAKGAVSFRADPYGWDGTLAQKIAAANRATALASR
jgi:L,D-transpeptidase YcbB